MHFKQNITPCFHCIEFVGGDGNIVFNYDSPYLNNSTLDCSELSASRRCSFTLGETASVTQWIGDCLNLTAGLDGTEKR
jgi:hypothetical protein